MFCFDCFPSQKTNNDDSVNNFKKISLKYYEKKHYLLNPLPEKLKNEQVFENCQEFWFIPQKYESISYPWIQVKFYEINKIFSQEKIPILFLSNLNSQSSTTLIFSHGLSTDIGQIYPLLLDICSQLKCNVISYDYTNPEKNNSISLENSYVSDLEEVVDFCITHLNINLSDMILMSKSLGSIPVLGMSTKEEYRNNMKGIVLISPISRGYIFKFKTINEEYDILQRSTSISIRVFIIHGKLDKVIKKEQSDYLCQSIRYVTKWFPSKENHYNLMTTYRYKFYNYVKKYINELDFSLIYSKVEYDNRYGYHSKQNSASVLTRPNETKDSIEYEGYKKRSMTSLKKTEIFEPINEISLNFIDLMDEEYSLTEKAVML